MRTTLGSCLAVLLAATLACGGSANDDDVFEEPMGGGGTHGDGGNDNSGGTRPSGGATMASGGTTAPGFGGSSGAARGGQGATSSGGTTAIPPDFPERCEALCASAAEARCENQEPMRDCVRQCRLSVQQPECVEPFEQLFACTENHEFSCGDDGRATVPGCELPFATAALCFLGNVPDPALREPCERYCTEAAVAACAGMEPHADCVYGCQSAGALAPACRELWDEYLTCSDGATFYCGEDDKAVPEGCEATLLTFAACLLSTTQ